jgi:hypothetical protein
MTIDDLRKASMEDLQEKYGDYPVWAAIQRAYDLGHAKAFGLSKDMTKSALDMGYMEGFADAAIDPSAWYVEDHGEVFKLGDRVWYRGSEQELIGFYRGDSGKVYPRLYESGLVGFSDISHTQPDSWEKLQADITNAVNSVCIGAYEAASFITRAKRLGGCDE